MKAGDKAIHIRTGEIFTIKSIKNCKWKIESIKHKCKFDVCPGYINGRCFGVENEFLVRKHEEDSLEAIIRTEVNRLKGGIR